MRFFKFVIHGRIFGFLLFILFVSKLLIYDKFKYKFRKIFTSKFLKKNPKNIPKLFFLKTHKTASSSIFNIFARFGIENNLKMTLPKIGGNVWPYPIDTWNLDNRTLNSHMNLIHSVYSKSVHNFFPKNETFYFTILRNTTKQWSSIFTFYDIGYIMKLDNSKESMRKYIDEYKNPEEKLPADFGAMTRNPNFYDFGYNNRNLDNEDKIKKAILEIDEIFDLVLITELWDSSILLLKQKLNLDFDDIVVLNANERIQKSEDLPEELKAKINEFNKADYQMYTYFYNKIKKESESLNEMDYEILKERKKFWQDTCVEKREPQILYSNVKFLGYKLKDEIPSELNETCTYMAMNEISLINFYKMKL